MTPDPMPDPDGPEDEPFVYERIRDEVPVSQIRDAMWAHELPADMATEIYGTIECVLADYVRTVIEYVEGAARVTPEELRERFDDDRRERGQRNQCRSPRGPEDERFVYG